MNKLQQTGETGKTKIGIISIAMSILSVILGLVIRKPFVDVISVGFIFSFLAMIMSLVSVKDHGKNGIAQIAFWLGFLSMWITVYLGASA